MIDSVSNLTWLALEDAIGAASNGPYWPGIADWLHVEDRSGHVVVASERGYTGQTTEPVVDGYAFLPGGGGYPETLCIKVGGFAGCWVRCPLCGVYASGTDRRMHYSIMGSYPLGCHDCRPPEAWTSVMDHEGMRLAPVNETCE